MATRNSTRILASAMLSATSAALLALAQATTAHATAAEAAAAADKTVDFHIAEQPMSEALTALGAQSDLTIIIETKVSKGVKAAALSGSYTPDEALRNLLEPAGLKAEYLDHKTVAIRAATDTARVATADPTSSLVQAEKSSLEEIVVTAQKRSEPLQQVPMSITTFTASDLEQRSVKNFMDYATAIPNLGFGITGDGAANARTISIRGIGGDNTTGFYLDETPVPDSIDPHITDVERIEVLRGPQGTLYGARSMGGTVRVIAALPDTVEFSSKTHIGLSSTVHTNTPNYLADGYVNFPLIDNRLALRVSGFYERNAGYFSRTFPSTTDPGETETVRNVARSKTSGGALSLLWNASDALTITPRVMLQDNRFNGLPYADLLYDPSGPIPRLAPRSFTQARQFDVEEGGHDTWKLSSLTARYQMAHGELVSSTSYFDRDVFETEDQSDIVNLLFFDPAGMPYVPSPISAGKTFRRFVQELRFASQFEGPVQFVAGAFYSYTNGRFDPGYYPPVVVPGLDASTGGALGSDVFFVQDNQREIEESAVFGEASYRATEKLKLTAGLRGYRIRSTSNDLQGGAVVGQTLIDPRATVTEDGVNPKFQADYLITPDHMVYATIAKGFRPGGVVPQVPDSPVLPCVNDLAQLGLTPADTRSFKADSLWNYEIGAKTAWAGNRLILNGAAFYVKWEDIQQTLLLPCGFPFRANAGAAKSEGFELEAHMRPTQQLDLSAGVGYQHAVITEVGTGSGALSPQRPGDRVYQVPDWTANLSATYTYDFSAAFSLVNNLSYSYVGNSTSANNDPFNPRIRPSYALLDASIGLKWSRHQLLLIGKNLADENANLADNRSLAVELPGRPRLVTNQPRTIGLELRSDF